MIRCKDWSSSILRSAMSIRRRSSAKVSPLDTPHEAEQHSTSQRNKPKSSSAARAKKQTALRSRNGRPVALKAPRPQPMTNLSLEELLEIKPPCIRDATTLDTGQATAQRVDEAKEALGKLECEIVTALFPPTGLPESLEQVATRLGMTVKEVRDVADNALRGLRGTKSSRPRLSSVWN